MIRAAVEGDAEAVVALSLMAQEFHCEAAPDRFKAADKAVLAAVFAEEIGSSDAVILLAEVAGGAVGYVFAKVNAQPEAALTYAHTALHRSSARGLTRSSARRSGKGTHARRGCCRPREFGWPSAVRYATAAQLRGDD